MPSGQNTGQGANPHAASPNSIPWPPILFAGALLVAWTGDALWPLRWLGPPAVITAAGALLIGAALALMGWSFWSFLRARANIRPDRAATVLIASGPFRLSRNPIYLSEAILLTGLGLWQGQGWYLVALAAFVPAVTHLAIRREEAHLAAMFGADWNAYAGTVRRWL